MYKKHIFIMTILFVCVWVISFCLDLEYSKISSDAITISSISTAIYTALTSALMNSELKSKMMNKDKIITWKTQLGVLAYYLKLGVTWSIINIIISCVVELSCKKFLNSIILRLIEALGMATLAIVLMFTWIMCTFIINRQLWDE